MTIYAFKGEVVTCENGHPVAQFERDVHKFERADPSALRFADGSTPEKGAVHSPCLCGADAFRFDVSGLVAFIGGQWRRTASPVEMAPA